MADKVKTVQELSQMVQDFVNDTDFSREVHKTVVSIHGSDPLSDGDDDFEYWKLRSLITCQVLGFTVYNQAHHPIEGS